MEERKQLKEVGIRRTSHLDNGKIKVFYVDGTDDEMTKEEFLGISSPLDEEEIKYVS